MPAGQSQAQFTITPGSVATATPIVITAKLGTTSQTTTLTVLPPSLADLFLESEEVNGGGSTVGYLMLTGPAPAGGTVISLASLSSSAQMPMSVTIPAGSSFGTFTVNTTAVTAQSSAGIVGTSNGLTRSDTLLIDPPAP